MPRTIETLAYQFHELSDRAKERARAWYRERLDFEPDYAIEDAVTIAAFLGWEVDTRPVRLMNGKTRPEPCVDWSVSYCQGDGACFTGRWSAAHVDAAKLREHAPQDADLHRIADRIAAVSAAAPWSTATATHSGRYYHARAVTIDSDDMAAEYDDDTERSREEWAAIDARAASLVDDLQDATRDFMDWIHARLVAEHEYQNSDEAVDESIEANGYEFDEDGAPV